MARRHPILRGLARLAAAVVGLLVVAGALALLFPDGTTTELTFGNSVGVLKLTGVLTDGTDAVEALDRLRRRRSTVAVVVRIDSPGGAVAPAQEIYDAIWRLRAANKPVVASMGTVAASAGYYIASAADVVVASPGTLTGSIGVIMQLPQYMVLAEKLGVSAEVVKTGPYKDSGNPLRPLQPEERAILQGLIDDVLAQFVEAVAKGRGIEVEKVRAVADGRVFTGAQAHAAGLVDQLGGLADAARIAWERAGQTGDPRTSEIRTRRRSWWPDLLGGALARLVGEGGPLGRRLLEDALAGGADWAVGGGLFAIYPGPVLR
jgi:protease-4